jgi:hypothetical protein
MKTPRLSMACSTFTLLASGAALAVPLTGVPNPTPKTPGFSAPNGLSPELTEAIVAQGSIPLENPATVSVGGNAVNLSYYGYNGDGPFLPAAGDLPDATHKVEASKTEPDKNTYLVLHGQHGADPKYPYGTRFLFQGHETGGSGYITRVNLEADPDHRVTLMAATDVNDKPLPVFDGSTWNPFARRLLFSAELGANGGIWQATVDFPSKVEDVSGAFGRGGFEGMQTDSEGNVWVVEDAGGPNGSAAAKLTHARQPNSFVYRFVPKHPHDLTQGRMQVLQVVSFRTGQPIVFHAGQADADILSDDTKDLNTYGMVFKTRWVTLHDTAIDGSAPFDANALAKTKGGTPFKRPENGQFRPGSGFREFFFDATGDTNALTEAGSAYGGFGAIFKLTQDWPGAEEGRLRLFYQCDVFHSGLDNVAFWDANHIVFVEDAGDTLHSQRNALDSAFLWDVRKDYSNPKNQPLRILAQGRDASATVDSGFGGQPGFQNEGDNEITGIHISDGDPGQGGLLGGKIPRPFSDGWRVFYTQQHGDNFTWEILPARPERWEDRDDD